METIEYSLIVFSLFSIYVRQSVIVVRQSVIVVRQSVIVEAKSLV